MSPDSSPGDAAPAVAGFAAKFGDMPRWRRQPYRLLFPLGVALAWAGVLHWVLHATGRLPDYRPVFHAITQIQGFMTCMAMGFLMTMIPRRTVTQPPTPWEMGAALVLPVATTVAAWFGRLAASQLFWALLVAVLIVFAVRRFTSGDAGRTPPTSFVWIPIAFGLGLVGSLLTAAPALGDDYFWLHQLGRLFLLQGVLLGLIAGVGGMALPLITRGTAPPDARPTSRDRLVRAGHLVGAALLAYSFWLEIDSSARAGLALRATIMFVILVFGARIWRLPTRPGLHRWFVWAAAWMVPLGYVLAAVFPEQKKAGMHVVFIGGFAMMALAVALHVSLAHGREPQRVFESPWQVSVLGGLLLLAMVARTLVDFDSSRFFYWIGVSGSLFLLASLFWAWLAVPQLPPD